MVARGTAVTSFAELSGGGLYMPLRMSRGATVGALSTRLNGGCDVEPVPDRSDGQRLNRTTDVDQECPDVGTMMP